MACAHFFRLEMATKKILRAVRFLALFVYMGSGLSQEFVIPLQGPANILAEQANGKFWVASGNQLRRFNQDGSLDRLFPATSIAGLGIENPLTLLMTDGSQIGRYDQDLSLEAGFSARSFALQPDGKILLWDAFALRRRNMDLSDDTTFTTVDAHRAGMIGATCLVLQGDGKILWGPSTNGSIVRFNANGVRDSNFTSLAIAGSLMSIQIQADGKIVVGGSFSKVGSAARNGLARLNTNGVLDTAFNPASQIGTSISSMAPQANGKIVLSGLFNFIGGGVATNFARINADGSLDANLMGSLGNAAAGVSSLMIQGSGAILAGISTNLVRIGNSDSPTQSLTHDATKVTWLRGGSCPEVFQTFFYYSVDGGEWFELGPGERIAGGWKLDGVGLAPSARVRARGYVCGTSYYIDYLAGAPGVLVHPESRTKIVGEATVFQALAEGSGTLEFQWFKNGTPIPGMTSPRLALGNLTGGDSGDYYFTVGNSEGSVSSIPATLTVTDPVIFTQPRQVWINAGDPFKLSVSAAGSGLTYQWKKDGTPITGATSSNLTVAASVGADSGVYQVVLTGTYGTLESDEASVHANVVFPDAWNPKFTETTQYFPIQVAAAHNNEAIVGGLFQTTSDPTRRDIIGFDANGAVTAFAPEPEGGEAGGVSGLAVGPDGKIYVGGNFVTIAGQAQASLARFNADGSFDEGFRPVIEGNQYVQVGAVEFLPDGRILIAGMFTSVNGEARPGVARLFADGTLDESFSPRQFDVPPVSSGLLRQLDGKILVYGWELRRLNEDGTPDLDWLEPINASSFGNVFALPNGQVLADWQSNLDPPKVNRLNVDGSIDADFSAKGIAGSLEGLQADGKFFTKRSIRDIEGIYGPDEDTRDVLVRYNADGTEDPTFSPAFDGFAPIKAIRADGSLIVGGRLKSIAGLSRPGLARIPNTESASESLKLEGTVVTWLRGGASPEVTHTFFEFSEDGIIWKALGEGARIDGGWQLSGVTLNRPGKVRAHGFSHGSLYSTAISVGSAILSLNPINRASDGRVLTFANAPAGMSVVLQVSTDLKLWSDLQTNLVTAGPLLLPLPTSAPAAFFRLRQE